MYGVVLVLGVGLVLSEPVKMTSCLRMGVGEWDVVVVCSDAGMRVRFMVVVVCIVGGIVDMVVECGVAVGEGAGSMSVLMFDCVGGVFVGFVVVLDGVLVRCVMDVVVVGFWFH